VLLLCLPLPQKSKQNGNETQERHTANGKANGEAVHHPPPSPRNGNQPV